MRRRAFLKLIPAAIATPVFATASPIPIVEERVVMSHVLEEFRVSLGHAALARGMYVGGTEFVPRLDGWRMLVLHDRTARWVVITGSELVYHREHMDDVARGKLAQIFPLDQHDLVWPAGARAVTGHGRS